MTLTAPPPSAHAAVASNPVTNAVVLAEGTRTVVVLRGEADFYTSPVLSDAWSRVVAARAGDVVVDLAEAEFIDPATVRVFAVGQQLLEGRGRTLAFRSPSRLAAWMLDLFGLADLIEPREGAQDRGF